MAKSKTARTRHKGKGKVGAPAAKKTVKAIPDGYDCVMPYLSIKGAAEAIGFYERAFGATVRDRVAGPEGKIMHAEVRIGNAGVMLADEFPEMGFLAPRTLGGSPVMLCLYVKDVDSFFARAVEAGATVKRPVEDQFYGDRSGSLADPWGHVWNIATHEEDLTPDEIRERARKAKHL